MHVIPWEGQRPPVSVVLVEVKDGQPRPLYPLDPKSFEYTTFNQVVTDGLVRGDQGAVVAVRMVAGHHFMLCVDVGSRDKLIADPDLLRQAGGKACAYLRSHPGVPDQCAVIMPSADPAVRPVPNDVRLVVEGFCLRNDNVSRTNEGQAAERTVGVPKVLACSTPELETMVERAIWMANAGRWVRANGNLRGEEGSPTHIAELAVAFLKRELGDKVQFPYPTTILDMPFYEGKTAVSGEAGAQARRWGGLLAVNQSMYPVQGLDVRPAGVLAVYKCRIPGARCLAINGKFITYDTGAWALKTPVEHMRTMHLDKHGFMTAVGLFIMLVKMKVPFDIVMMGNGTYNLPGILPGSFFTSRGGRQVEDHNPDAEGRIVLGDGIDYLAEAYNPDIIMPIATLTGASSVALGPMINLFGSDPVDPLMLSVFGALRRSGILGWPLPYGFHLEKGMSSPEGHTSNIDHSGAKQAGQSTAALYLLRELERAIQNYGNGRPHQPILHDWDIAPLYSSKPDGWRLDGASVDPLLATVWSMEGQGFPGGVLVPRSV